MPACNTTKAPAVVGNGAGERHPVVGYIYIGAAALFWGISANLGRAVFTGRILAYLQSSAPIDPVILSQTRTTFSFLILLPILIARSGWRRLRLPSSDLIQLFLLGTLGTAGSNYFYYLAIERTNVATAIILQYTAPVWVLIYMVARGFERPTWRRIAAVVLALAGIAMVINVFSDAGFLMDAVGLTAAVLAAFAFAYYNVSGHSLLARYDRWTVLLYALAGASLFWAVIDPPWKIAAAHHSTGQWLFLLVFSMVSALAPFSFYAAGLQCLEPTHAIVVSCMEPVFTILIAAFALGELLRSIQVAGVVLVLAAIVVIQAGSSKAANAETILEPIE